MCSIAGVTGMPNDSDEAVTLSMTASSVQQGRGNQSAGVAWFNGRKISVVKSKGRVDNLIQVIKKRKRKNGSVAISHTRYGTEGAADTLQNAQPLVSEEQNLAVAHNGEIIGACSIRENLESEGVIFNTTSDSEVILRLLEKASGDGIIAKITSVLNKISGAYALVIIWDGYLIGVVDGYSVHPLTLGVFKNGGHIFASEDTAIKAVGARPIEDLDQGQIIVVTPDMDVRKYRLKGSTNGKNPAHCAFNLVYTCMPPSKPWGISVSNARKACGAATFDEMVKRNKLPQVDVVVPMLDSGRTSTLAFAAKLGHYRMMNLLRESGPEAIKHADLDYLNPYQPGVNRAHDADRNFMLSTQIERELAIGLKHLVDSYVVKNKRVMVGDDSFVRGTTAKMVTNLLREFGATEVHWVVFSPRIISSCHYGGTETKDEDLLIASRTTIPQARDEIGAESLYHISMPGFKRVLSKFGDGFCTACWDNKFPIPIS